MDATGLYFASEANQESGSTLGFDSLTMLHLIRHFTEVGLESSSTGSFHGAHECLGTSVLSAVKNVSVSGLSGLSMMVVSR